MKKPSLNLLLAEAVAAYVPPPRTTPTLWHVGRTVEVFVEGAPQGIFTELFNRRSRIRRLIRAAEDALASGREDLIRPLSTTLISFPDDTPEAIRERFLELLEEA